MKIINKTTIVYFTVVVLFFSFLLPALALETGLGYGTATGLSTQDIRITAMKIVRAILGFVGVVAILIILYGGFIWMTSAGNAEKIEKAKKILINAVIGLVIIFSAFMIVSFIIGVLQRAVGPGGGTGAPPSACENCGHLGSGIIQSVYPQPFARDVARNTNIMVTFKVEMDPGTIIDGCSTVPCSGNLISDNVLIFPYNQGEAAKLDDNAVVAQSSDGKTFIFNPVDYLGDGVSNIWHAVKLTNRIEKDNGESAFPGAGGYFLWTFEIGTFLDFDPVEVSNVFPQPDNQGDLYSETPALQATGSISVGRLPTVAQNAEVGPASGTPEAPALTVFGTYNCSQDTFICISTSDGLNFNIDPKSSSASDCSASNISISGLADQAPLSGGAVNIGCGLTLSFADTPVAGNQWSFGALAQKAADTLRVDNRLYTFVASGADAGQINRGATISQTAGNIAAKINGDDLSVSAAASGSTINLTAKLAGNIGNSILLQTSSGWATVDPMSGGQNAGFIATVQGVPDKPRNAIIIIDFNEAINPAEINKDNVIVEYDKEGSGWAVVLGSYFVSNQYQTVEILSNEECVDESGEPIINSCGDKIYCWPFNDAAVYQPTHYRVTVKAGLLKNCATNNDCTDPNFSFCVPTPGPDHGQVCHSQSIYGGANYPEARTPAQGVTDAANNSFNGNKNTYTLNTQIYGQADGPFVQSNQGPYSLNNEVTGTGDDLIWEFYINKNVDLSPPEITGIGPDIGAAGVSLVLPVESTFSEVMMSSSLKPGSNYRDGNCYCDETNTACPAGQTCDTDSKKCKSDTGQDNFCLEDKECPLNNPIKQCVNKKYVTLVDRSVFPVGWWVTKENLDTILPLDSYADQTKGLINHTRFIEVTSYGAEVGSGVKDAFQNCFLPSAGPGVGIDCPVSAARPYCCNGVAMSQDEWEASACFTGY